MNAPRSLRWRLTALFVTVAALVIGGGALGMSALLDEAVWGPLDAALAEEGETIASLLPLEHEQVAHAVAAIGAETDLGPGKFVEVSRGRDVTVAHAGRVPRAVRGGRGPVQTRTLSLRLREGAQPYRLVRHFAADGTSILIGVQVRRHLRTLGRARVAIITSSVALLAVLAVLAWIITSRATGELGRLAQEIERIEAGSLDRRVAPRRTLEVDRLGVVLNRLLGRLEAAMGELRRFTADASHELRTPIAALRAHLEVALGRGDSLAVYRDGLLDGLEQTERLGRLAEDLLTLASVEGGGLDVAATGELTHLDVLAAEVVEVLEPVAQEHGRRLSAELTPDVCVWGVPGLLKRVLLNLLENAFRHTTDSAAVSVIVRAEGPAARIEVRDTGAGIAPADLPHVFDRFRRGRAAGSGAGLGLALCREIVARHGGQITVESRPGEGTRVEIRLPRMERPPATESPGILRTA